MKKRIIFVLAIATLGVFSCTLTEPVRSGNKAHPDDTVIVVSNMTNLASMLAQAPGVLVEGTDPFARVTIRGQSPLFVLDGVWIGQDYSEVVRLVNVSDITAIEILKSPSETMRYGRVGSNGVIVIHTGEFDLENRDFN